MLRLILVMLAGLSVASPVTADARKAAPGTPSDTASKSATAGAEVAMRVKVKKSVRRISGEIGVTYKTLPAKYAHVFGLPPKDWIVIGAVLPASGAQHAGVEPGDIFLRIDGQNVSSSRNVLDLIAVHEPGSELELVVWRRGADAVLNGLGVMADAGDVQAALLRATIHARRQNDGDRAEAIRWFRKAADAGSIAGMLNLAWRYRNGVGVDQNEEEAKNCSRKAAAAGSTAARLDLLVRANNYSEIVRIRREAAERGDTNAMYALAKLYEEGKGLERDYGQALAWYRKAGEAGHVMSAYNVGVAYDSGRGVEQNAAMAAEWYQRAAEGGSIGAMQNLAEMYEIGSGVRKDPAKAAAWRMEVIAADVSTAGQTVFSGKEVWAVAAQEARRKRLRAAGIYRGLAPQQQTDDAQDAEFLPPDNTGTGAK